MYTAGLKHLWHTAAPRLGIIARCLKNNSNAFQKKSKVLSRPEVSHTKRTYADLS